MARRRRVRRKRLSPAHRRAIARGVRAAWRRRRRR